MIEQQNKGKKKRGDRSKNDHLEMRTIQPKYSQAQPGK
jgi:hypothetical protein